MKPRIFLLPSLLGSFCLSGLHGETAEAVRTAPTTTQAIIPTPVVETVVATTPVEKPNFQIETTQVKLIDVVEAPPMPSLPPVKGTIKLTVNGVANPGLPEPTQPDVAANEPQVGTGLTELTEPHEQSYMASVSATVYDHSRTLLTCQAIGGGSANQPVTAWSNIDFNNFKSVGNFNAAGSDGHVREYCLLMGIGNESSASLALAAASEGVPYESPKIPALPNGALAFVILTENPDPESLKLIEDLHALYRNEGVRLVKEAAARQKEYEKKEAYLLAHPPKPKDVTVNFWKREVDAEMEGAQP
jgi:hypothetical protein